ncbi:Cuticle protein 6 [Zootermopsis nevadensis]|uniref:Cuticle protein 6 n=1 Tax=Zootermopsis nevadensis TaxID=136037 RepID=A0A067QRV8_ZOONE|nr:Cuticle protein 6 [Zootermopsis nevadensis]
MSDITEGQVEGKRGLGRRLIQLTDDLKQGKKMTFQELKREAKNRDNWRALFGQSNGPVMYNILETGPFCDLQKNLPFLSILSQLNPVHILMSIKLAITGAGLVVQLKVFVQVIVSCLMALAAANPSILGALPYAAAPVAIGAPAQDTLGQYSYGYADRNSEKHEARAADGTTHGGYSYVDGHGLVQSVKYHADSLGFRVAATNLPVGPAAP